MLPPKITILREDILRLSYNEHIESARREGQKGPNQGSVQINKQTMCGKKSNHREGGQEQPRREYLDTSLFYYEYLNNSLNYILSGKNDLDHVLQFDIPAARQITSTEPIEENLHFVERVKLMKTRCDPNTYLKDVQEYGEFINYEVSRAHNQQMANIEAQLREEFQIGVKLKRIKKRYKRNDDKLTLYQIEQNDKQWREDILNGIISQMEGQPTEIDHHLEQNKLYREMFNIQEVATIKKEEKAQTRKVEKVKNPRGPKRKTNQDYIPSNAKNRESYGERLGAALEKIAIEDKVKKEEYVEKNPIRFFTVNPPPPTNTLPTTLLPPPAPLQSQINPPAPPVQIPTKLAPNNSVLPMVILPVQQITSPLPIFEIKPIQKIQNEPPPIKQPLIIQKPLLLPIQKEETVDLPLANDSNNPSSTQKKKKKEKKIEKEEKEEKVKDKGKKRGPKQKQVRQKQPQRQKRKYHKKKPNQHEDVKFPTQIPQFIAPVNAAQYVSRATSCVEIGIQADANEDFQNLKVIAPRQLPFTFEPIRPAIPPVGSNPPQEEKRQIAPERKEPVNVNPGNNYLNHVRQMPERTSQEQPASNRIEATEVREEPPQVLPQSSDSLRRNNESHEKKDDFDISDYLI